MVSVQLYSQSSAQENSGLQSRWAIFSSKSSAVLGLLILCIIFILSLSSLFIDSSNTNSLSTQLIPPSWHEQGTSEHLLGTDLLGRDIFSRLLEGAPLTFGISLLSVTFALLVGVGLGLVAAFYRKHVQLAVMRSMDIIFAIPSLVLAIIVVSILGPGLVNAGLAVAIVLLPNFVRTTISHVIEEMNKAYVDAAKLDGATPSRILLKSVFPNVAAPLTLQTTIALSTAIVDIAALGFLGLGAQAPQPEWGAMLAEARTSMHIAPWVVTLPGLAILITVLSINFFGDGLNRIINNKMRH